jgi:hypothetical protein
VLIFLGQKMMAQEMMAIEMSCLVILRIV